MSLKRLVDTVNYEELRRALSLDSSLANEGIPFDEANLTKAHPLHRICDGVFAMRYSDEEAVEMAKIFLDYGSNVDGYELREKQDTPVIAAASLNAEKVGILYIDKGANIHHAGCHGGTALHWAAWCGKDKLVDKLIQANAEINRICIDFKSTPLFWAVHGLKHGGDGNKHNQVECARMLINAGADKTIPNLEGITALELLSGRDDELIRLLA